MGGFPELADVAWLRGRYLERGESTLVIAAGVGCDPSTVNRALRRHGIRLRSRGDSRARHGHRRGDERSPTYESWKAMLDRCYRPSIGNFERYGGCGITVCDRWRPAAGGSFENFLADLGERPAGRTLDRVDSGGNYEPGNCRWATASEQNLNRRPRSAA